MALRVAYLVNQYPAVSHSFIRREIRALERRGIEVERIALRGWDLTLVDPADLEERTRTRYVLRSGALRLAASVLSRLIEAPRATLATLMLALRMSRDSDRSVLVHLAYLAEACLVKGWLDASACAHLHAHFATNATEVAMLTHSLGGPSYSFTAHGSDIMDRPAQIGLVDKVTRAAFVVAVCSFGRSQIMKWVPSLTWERIHVVRCGLDANYGAVPGTPAVASHRFLCVGRLSREKGQRLLVEAASLLAQADIPVEVVLAGDGPMRAELEQYIADRKLDRAVRITGWLSEANIETELRQARALIVSSLSEGLPVVVMEAMASRLPVIAPYLAGIPELVVSDRTGWLYPAGDPTAMAAAMRTCVSASDPQLRAMGEEASKRVRMLHDVDLEADKLCALIGAHRSTR